VQLSDYRILIHQNDTRAYFADKNDYNRNTVTLVFSFNSYFGSFRKAGCTYISGLAVHWEDEIIFWSDTNLGHIMYSQLDGRYHAFLLTGLAKPKALAIDPVEG